MTETGLKLRNPPIVEAMLDIECVMPERELALLKMAADDSLLSEYPRFEVFYPNLPIHVGLFSPPPQPMPLMPFQRDSLRFQYAHRDGKQLIQIRKGGYSFNRLAPYSTLDDYLEEIERTWKLFVRIAQPVSVRGIRMRYVNRILLPAQSETLDLEGFLRFGPRLPDRGRLMFMSFFDQHVVVDKETGSNANVVLATQTVEGDQLPLVFDITVVGDTLVEPADWAGISEKIQLLRSLKNLIFQNTLTEECLKLFQ